MTITESKLRDMIHEELIKYLIDEGILDEGLMDMAKSKLAPYALGLVWEQPVLVQQQAQHKQLQEEQLLTTAAE